MSKNYLKLINSNGDLYNVSGSLDKITVKPKITKISKMETLKIMKKYRINPMLRLVYCNNFNKRLSNILT